MHHLEPTYLRYIYDGLVKGSIHPENAAELPEGLIGLYEEAFDERTSVVERQKLLERFAIWALLKKEVSVAFVAEVLGEIEDDIQDFISTYSAWFNSPESGKYQLYHERLKVYLLQKLSEKEIHELHEKLISRLEKAIEEQQADEFEWYGLEFLGYHYSIQSKSTKDIKYAKDLFHCFYKFQSSKATLTRQKQLSYSYKWSKNNLYLLSELAIIFESNITFNISDLACEILNEENYIIDKLEILLGQGDHYHSIQLISELQDNEIESIELKLYYILFFVMACNEPVGIKNSVPLLEDLLSKHAGELFYLEHLIPSSLILSICIKLNNTGISSDFIIKSCENWTEDSYCQSSVILDYINNLDGEINELLASKINSVKNSNDFLCDKFLSNELVSKVLSFGSAAIRLEIETRNSEFQLSQQNVVKPKQITLDFLQPLQTLELLESLNNFEDESEVFYFFVSSLGEFNFINAYSLLKCFQTFGSQNLKDILIKKFWRILIVDTDLIDLIFEVSKTSTLYRLSTNSEVLHEIVSISQTNDILNACATIIEIRKEFQLPGSLDTSFCCSFDDQFEFKFSCLVNNRGSDQIERFFKLKHEYFIELFDSNFDTDILNFNIPIYQELAVFCAFCKKKLYYCIDELLLSFVQNTDHYEKWQFDENLFFLIDELNKRKLYYEAYKLLILMKAPLLQKVTLVKSFSNWAFFNDFSLSFRNESLSFIHKHHRPFIILGWLKNQYSSISFDFNVDNALPNIPNSIISRSIFIENQIFIIERPDILRIFALKMITQENKPNTLESFFPFLYRTQINKN
jgi:hypothetical protein